MFGWLVRRPHRCALVFIAWRNNVAADVRLWLSSEVVFHEILIILLRQFAYARTEYDVIEEHACWLGSFGA